NGDVWTVAGIGETFEQLSWRRIATGLFQPLGVEIVDDEIYVLGRDQITRLHDLNGDGETDFYENFNNDHMVSEHFHEFAFDLKLGPDGDFYYTKGARHAREALHPQHGTLIRVSRDGSRSEIIARGFRSPNGLGVGSNGEFVISDNQGHWTPANRINWVEPGGFYGNMWSFLPTPPPEGYDPPLTWMPNSVDRSPGTFAWVPDLRWGPLAGRLISISYGMGRIFHVMHERVGGVMQGGVVRLPLDFDTGVMRARFRNRDGQLYVCGLFGWDSNKTQPGGFYRVRYTGGKLYLPEEIHALEDGVVVKFTDPLDAESVADVGNFSVSRWNYRWTENYGSDEYKLDGEPGRDRVEVQRSVLLPDGRSVFLEIPDIQPVMQMRIEARLLAEDGTEFNALIHHTIHELAPRREADLLAGATRVSDRTIVRHDDYESGLIQRLESRASAGEIRDDSRHARLPALYVAEGQPPSPFLPAGPLSSTWEGVIRSDINTSATFSLEGSGSVSLEIDGREVLSESGEVLGEAVSARVRLRSGDTPFTLAYDSPPEGDAVVRLYWTREDSPREPIPPTVLFHDPSDQSLGRGELLRRGRQLVATRGCIECHITGDLAGEDELHMAELAATAPSFEGIGSRLKEDWMARWILDPSALKPGATMPAMFASREPGLAKRESRDIAAFLSMLQDPASRDADHLAADGSAGPSDQALIATGRRLYDELGCIACHRLGGEDAGIDDDRLSLAGSDRKWRTGALQAYLLQPNRFHAGSPMPDFDLAEREARAIALYLRAEAGGPTLATDGFRQTDPDHGPSAGELRRRFPRHLYGPGNAGTIASRLDIRLPGALESSSARARAPPTRWHCQCPPASPHGLCPVRLSHGPFGLDPHRLRWHPGRSTRPGQARARHARDHRAARSGRSGHGAPGGHRSGKNRRRNGAAHGRPGRLRGHEPGTQSLWRWPGGAADRGHIGLGGVIPAGGAIGFVGQLSERFREFAGLTRRTRPFDDAQDRRDTRFARSSATVFVFVKIGQPRSAPKGFDDRIAVGSGKRGHVQGGSDGCTSAPDLAHFVREAVERVEMGRLQVNARGIGDGQYHPRMMLALLIYCCA
ncbi:c-type cytochrome, partial [Candidatus Sumerlaeota bacterium]|nr:c-type cytochrome [Candidatus Sumerlaeota bacterium]